jgi:hypothetical protein
LIDLDFSTSACRTLIGNTAGSEDDGDDEVEGGRAAESAAAGLNAAPEKSSHGTTATKKEKRAAVPTAAALPEGEKGNDLVRVDNNIISYFLRWREARRSNSSKQAGGRAGWLLSERVKNVGLLLEAYSQSHKLHLSF